MIHRFPSADDADPEENPPDSDLDNIPDLPPRPTENESAAACSTFP